MVESEAHGEAALWQREEASEAEDTRKVGMERLQPKAAQAVQRCPEKKDLHFLLKFQCVIFGLLAASYKPAKKKVD